MKKATQPKVVLANGILTITFDGIPHLMLKAEEIIGFQSWVGWNDGIFYIEYITKSRDVKTEYDTLDKWKAILQQLKHIIP